MVAELWTWEVVNFQSLVTTLFLTETASFFAADRLDIIMGVLFIDFLVGMRLLAAQVRTDRSCAFRTDMYCWFS